MAEEDYGIAFVVMAVNSRISLCQVTKISSAYAGVDARFEAMQFVLRILFNFCSQN